MNKTVMSIIWLIKINRIEFLFFENTLRLSWGLKYEVYSKLYSHAINTNHSLNIQVSDLPHFVDLILLCFLTPSFRIVYHLTGAIHYRNYVSVKKSSYTIYIFKIYFPSKIIERMFILYFLTDDSLSENEYTLFKSICTGSTR